MISQTFPFAPLTAVGTTNAINIAEANNASFNIVVSNIGTNVVVRAEYSLNNGTTWTNCNAADTTITADGQYSIPVLANNNSLPLVRFRLVSISTGTPTVTPVLRIS